MISARRRYGCPRCGGRQPEDAECRRCGYDEIHDLAAPSGRELLLEHARKLARKRQLRLRLISLTVVVGAVIVFRFLLPGDLGPVRVVRRFLTYLAIAAVFGLELAIKRDGNPDLDDSE